MNPYETQVLADSVNPARVRLVTLLVNMPRFILAEFNTHRMFSRCSASSRAIPVEKRIAAVRASPFVPEAFGANKRGMSAGDNLQEYEQAKARLTWLDACKDACDRAEYLASIGVHKQWASRLIEPFMWHPVIVSATEWSNFFHQRISEHAQPEMRRTAESMFEAMEKSKPSTLMFGEWHLPMIRDEDYEWARDEDYGDLALPQISAARCGRVSYMTHDGRRDPTADLNLYHATLHAKGHFSPLEHPASATNDDEFIGNFRGFRQLRKTIHNESDFLGRPS